MDGFRYNSQLMLFILTEIWEYIDRHGSTNVATALCTTVWYFAVAVHLETYQNTVIVLIFEYSGNTRIIQFVF